MRRRHREIVAVMISAVLTASLADVYTYALSDTPSSWIMAEQDQDELNLIEEEVPCDAGSPAETVLQEDQLEPKDGTEDPDAVVPDPADGCIIEEDDDLSETAETVSSEVQGDVDSTSGDTEYDALETEYSALSDDIIFGDEEQGLTLSAADVSLTNISKKQGNVIASGKMYQGIIVRIAWTLDEYGTLRISYDGSLTIERLCDQSAYGEPVTDYTDQLADQVKTVVYDSLTEGSTIYNIGDYLTFPNARTLILGANVTGKYNYYGEDEQGNDVVPAYEDIVVMGSMTGVTLPRKANTRKIRVLGSVGHLSARENTLLEAVYIASYTGSQIGDSAFRGDTSLKAFVVEHAS